MTHVRTIRPPRVIVGIDGSEQCKQAQRWAAYFAGSAGARVDAVTAWQYPTGYGWGAAPLGWSPGHDMEETLTGLLLGSVSANIAEHATCPVLVHGDQTLTEAAA